MESIIILTSNAIKQIKGLKESLSLDNNHYLRIGVKGGKGCIGATPFVAFDYKKEKDALYNIQGIDVLIDKSQTMHLMGLQLDYYEDSNSKGFVFESPADIEA